MLTIRLARSGKHKSPFYRIVLTEHTKPVQSGYKEVLGWFNPIRHEMQADIEEMKAWIGKGARPSSRVAKLAHDATKDDFFKKYIVTTERTRTKRNADEE